MIIWAFQSLKSKFISTASTQSSISYQPIQDFTSILHVPGFQFSIYHSIEGDSFLSIARKFNLSEETLRSLNQANDSTQPTKNTSIIISSKNGIFHIVRPGQGLSDISKAYGISLGEILKANHKRDDSDLLPGEILYLPGAIYLSRQDMRWVALLSLQDSKGFLKPTTGRFADGFGKRKDPINGKIRFHAGLDLAPGWRARVVAAQDGKVIFAGIRAGYGNLIILDHGGFLTTWYGHLDEILVKPQQLIKRGDLIGRVGNSGRTTGPHLHFEVRLSGKPQNPLLYLRQ